MRSIASAGKRNKAESIRIKAVPRRYRAALEPGKLFS
jgi:hypothetical protein